ncbi:MAG: SDR family oxidoreductase, partial [Rhizobiaceae bacterium]
KHDSAGDPDLKTWEEHMAVNVRAPALLASRIALQNDIDSGMIVNIIDQRVWALTPNYFSYTLSKSALWTATRTMALEFAPKIRVNAIGPGPTLPNVRQSQSDFDAQTEGLILKRGPKLDEFGATIRYLYGMDSITGQMIALDGGQHLAWETPDVIDANE